MGRLAKGDFGYILVISLLAISLAVTACGSDSPGPGPTPELAVVVFSTEEPTVVATEEKISDSGSVPAGPTVGAGANGASINENTQVDDSLVSSTLIGFNRPPDINPLTGLKVDDQAVLHRRPLMVRLGNDPEARPQVGLNEADMVYEEIVEWWVTRFTAIYLSQDLEMIAPIRSARLINLQLTAQYQGVLANSGGSDPVRWELSQSDIVNLDEYFVPYPYFYRENEGWQTRLALDATAARDYLLSEGLESDVGLRGFVFSQELDLTDLPKEAVGEANEVIIPYPQVTSEAKWVFDKDSGRYLRFTTGEPMMDFDGNQIAASNVIIYFAEHQKTNIVEDSNGATSIRITVNGLGTAWLLRDGKFLKGNWETDGYETPNFIFNDGRPMPLKPGNSWVEVVPLDFLIEIDGVSHARLNEATINEQEATAEKSTVATEEPTPTLTPIGARPLATVEAN